MATCWWRFLLWLLLWRLLGGRVLWRVGVCPWYIWIVGRCHNIALPICSHCLVALCCRQRLHWRYLWLELVPMHVQYFVLLRAASRWLHG